MPNPTKLIPLAEVCSRTCRSRWWLRDEWLAGRFPRPVPVGYRSTIFVEAEIEAWIQAMVSARDSQRSPA
jgi:prophage regulatory protein